MKAKIIVNGREYDSVEDLPPELRQNYERAMSLLADSNANGVPDIMEGMVSPSAPVQVQTVQTSRIVYEGREYNSPTDLPPEARRRYEQALSKLNQVAGGIISDMDPQPPVVNSGAVGSTDDPWALPPLVTSSEENRAARVRQLALVLGIFLIVLLIAVLVRAFM